MVLGTLSSASAAPPPLFDFTTEAGRQGWQPTHDIKSLATDAEGLRIEGSGNDPYAYGPEVAVPPGPLWLHIRLKSTADDLGP